MYICNYTPPHLVRFQHVRQIEGKPMWAGREMPLIEVEDRDYRIRWCATSLGFA